MFCSNQGRLRMKAEVATHKTKAYATPTLSLQIRGTTLKLWA